MPPAVALLNYISCGILWRIFSQTGTFAGDNNRAVPHFYGFFSKIGISAGLSLNNINFAERRWRGGGIIVFRLQRSSG